MKDFDIKPAAVAAGLLIRRHIKESHSSNAHDLHHMSAGFAATAIAA